MNIEVLASLLRSRPQIAQWQVTERRSRRRELYQTFQATESERACTASRWTVWISLVADGDQQGESSFTITPADGGVEVRGHLDRAIAAARAAPNPVWCLPGPHDPGVARPVGSAVHVCEIGAGAATAARMQVVETGLSDSAIVSDPVGRLGAMAAAAATAMQDAPWARLSALELFATIEDRRLVNHQGLDLCERRTRLYAEYVLLHGDGEYYDQVEAASIKALDLSRRITEAAAALRESAGAVAPTPGAQDVLIPDHYLAGLLGWYAIHADAALHVRGIAALAEGAAVVEGEPVERLQLASDAQVPSLAAYRFDEHGYAGCRQPLVEGGRLAGLCGSGRWMQRLGRPPRGQLATLVAPAGCTPLADLRRDVLEVVRFSEFRPRNDTGAFSGEIRFGWLHRADGRRVAVKGGSVSGVLRQAMAGARFSAEVGTTAGYHGPVAVRLPAVVAA